EYDRGYLDVIPNPSNKYIDLNLPTDIGLKKVRILKPTGEEVRNYSVDLLKRITVEQLSAGIYFLEVVTSDDHVYNTKFIKN
nr:T9SS type A sorting domain-containing protein [Bacteroidia bacterium]